MSRVSSCWMSINFSKTEFRQDGGFCLRSGSLRIKGL